MFLQSNGSEKLSTDPMNCLVTAVIIPFYLVQMFAQTKALNSSAPVFVFSIPEWIVALDEKQPVKRQPAQSKTTAEMTALCHDAL